MPWTDDHYPASMKNLPPLVRAKAIGMANALLEDGYPEGHAIRVGIARAKAWVARHYGVAGLRGCLIPRATT